jgi:hypothetical protein
MEDLCARFDIGLRIAFEESRRGDEHLAHSSHLGHCLLKTWFSRSRYPEIPKSTRTYQLLLVGLHIEKQYVVEIFRQAYAERFEDGWNVLTEISMHEEGELTGHLDIEIARVKGKDGQWARWSRLYEEWREPGSSQVMVVADEEIERRIIDVKTTEWKWGNRGDVSAKTGKPIKSRGPYPEVSVTHRLQALDYALQRPVGPDGKRAKYAIFQWDRNLNGYYQYPAPGEWFDPDNEDWLAVHAQWRQNVIDLTNPEVHPAISGIAELNENGMLVGRPPEEWQCDFCGFYQCANNKNPEKDNMKVEEVPFL